MDQIIRYDQDGGVTLIEGDRTQSIAPGWSDADVDAAAAAFFTAQN
jgi:hypothetical protein